MARKEHTSCYFNKEFDQALRECDEARAEKLQVAPQEVKQSEFGCRNCLWNSCECQDGSLYKPKGDAGCQGYTYYD